MSVTVDVSERQLKWGIVKLGLSIALLLAIIALGLSALVGNGQEVSLSLLFLTISFSAISHGVLAILKIIDWFEARKRNHG